MNELWTFLFIVFCCLVIVFWLFTSYRFSSIAQSPKANPRANPRATPKAKQYAWQKLDKTQLTHRITTRMKGV